VLSKYFCDLFDLFSFYFKKYPVLMAPKKVTDVEKPKRKIIMTTVEPKKELTTNGLIQFTLFLMGKFNSKVEQIESRIASWNGLCSTFEGPLYIDRQTDRQTDRHQ
jgi:hypothetical protein